MQNVEAHTFARAHKNSHAVLILRYFHCLPVKQRTELKIIFVIFSVFHGLTVDYISDVISKFKVGGFISCSTARVIYRQVVSIATC